MNNLTYPLSNGTDGSVASKVGSVLMGFCAAIGIPGNIMVMVIIIRHFKKDNFTLHLMLNLALSDVLGLISLPVWIYHWISGLIFSRGVCKFLVFLIGTSMYSGVLTVTLMSIHRYVVVLHRSKWAKLGRRWERVLLCCLWILALILCSPVLATADIVAEGQSQYCWRTSRMDQETLTFRLCELILGFVLPLSIMAILYSRLQKKVNKTAFFGSPRLAKLVTSIILTFVILWFPFYVINFAKVLAIAVKSTNPSVSKKLINFWDLNINIPNSLTFFNSCANPLLYAYTFRKRFKKSGKAENNTIEMRKLQRRILCKSKWDTSDTPNDHPFNVAT